MKNSRVTISDVARSLSLSTCTVSKVLNREFSKSKYPEATIQRVTEKAREMGYVPNSQARGLRTRRSMLIGFLLPSAQASLFSTLTDQIERQLRPHGYQVLIAHSHREEAGEQELVKMLLARGVDGLIWVPGREQTGPAERDLREDFPAVILDRPGSGGRLPFVATDNAGATERLARRMHAMGHRRVLALNAPEGDRSMNERFQGLAKVFGAGLRAVNGPNESGAAKEAVMKTLRRSGRLPDALVALSESLAIGALGALRDLDLAIPGEISFASFDDFPLAGHWSPRVTVIRQDVAKLAQAAVETVLARIQAPSMTCKNVRVPAEIDWRESVSAPRTAFLKNPDLSPATP